MSLFYFGNKLLVIAALNAVDKILEMEIYSCLVNFIASWIRIKTRPP